MGRWRGARRGLLRASIPSSWRIETHLLHLLCCLSWALQILYKIIPAAPGSLRHDGLDFVDAGMNAVGHCIIRLASIREHVG